MLAELVWETGGTSGCPSSPTAQPTQVLNIPEVIKITRTELVASNLNGTPAAFHAFHIKLDCNTCSISCHIKTDGNIHSSLCHIKLDCNTCSISCHIKLDGNTYCISCNIQL